jgi:hypothetical protein
MKKTPRRQKKATPKQLAARQAVKLVRELLIPEGDLGEAIWLLLTALRGPDSGDIETKEVTTEVIRGALFPRFNRSIFGKEYFRNKAMYIVNPTKNELRNVGRVAKAPPSLHNPQHFQDHCLSAIRVLRDAGLLD